MKRHHSFVRWSLPTLIVASAFLSGCGWMHRDKVEYYKGASETRPLEVPPDLDAPTSAKALVVPGTSSAAAPSSVTPAAAAGSSASAMTPPASAEVSADPNELHVADSADSTWQRVGLALERAQLGKVASKDQAARSYAFDFEGPVDAAAVPTEHHWYTRVLHPFGGDESTSHAVRSALRINVSDDAGGARVTVSGGADDKVAPAAARRVIAMLRERLS